MLTLSNARMIDPEGGRVVEGGLVIADGAIREIFEGARPGLDCGGKYLAPGIIDIGVKIGEPGERHKESFRTAGAAAAAGGVTTMVTRPDTHPAIDNPEVLEFILRRAIEAGPVHVLPMAALTKGREGREMTEIGFLIDAGAVAFTDAQAVANPRVFQRCLTYAAGLGALIVGHPQDPALSAGACATSGQYASQLGLPSVSPMAERIGLERDLAIVEMTGARYHADQISTARALPALARAKAAGLRVTAGCSIHHLTLNELDVGDYRTFFKLTPPLRSEDDRMAMVEALAAGADRRDRLVPHPAGRGGKAPALRGGGVRRGGARDAAAGGDAALPRRPSRPARAMAGAVAESRRDCSGSGRGASAPARRPIWCCSTRTRRSCSTAPRCARSPRTPPTTCGGCRGGCCGPGSAGRRSMRAHDRRAGRADAFVLDRPVCSPTCSARSRSAS